MKILIKTSSYEKFILEPYKNRTNYTHDDFKGFSLPTDKIELKMQDSKEFIVFEKFKSSNNCILVATYKNNKIIDEFHFYINKLPRIYLHCQKKCKYKVIADDFSCLKSPRTCHNCMLTKEINNVKISYCESELNKLLSLFEILKYMNEPKEIIRKNTIHHQIDKVIKKNTEYITISKKKYVYDNFSKLNKDCISNNKKSEHIRAGHYRKYKNGKVIFIKQTTVNKGKGEKTYKI